MAESVGVSASASVRPMNIQDWFPLGLTDLISLVSIIFCLELDFLIYFTVVAEVQGNQVD